MSIKLAARLFALQTAVQEYAVQAREKTEQHGDKGGVSLEQAVWGAGLFVAAVAGAAIFVAAIQDRTALIK